MSTLIDTSAWIDFFRGERAARRKVDPLLESGDAVVCGPVVAEVVSGARDRATYQRLSLLLGALPSLEATSEVWRQVAELRFLLARQGTQAHLVDLFIAVTASHHRVVLLTRDRDFVPIAKLLALDLARF